MESFLKDASLTSSKENNEKNIDLEEQKTSNANNNKNKIEEKYFIKSENKDNKEDKNLDIKEDKYLIESNLLNSKTFNKKNILEKTEKNSDKFLNLKILVKSKYILKKILLFLDEKRKLHLLKYNKDYHKLMGINIDNYKKLSGKIKIGGINGYGKEYGIDEFNLIFKGYYKNGKRNGKGKNMMKI